jgi:hypothetical protein
MSKETTDAGKLGDWQGLLTTINANMPALNHLEPLRAQFATQYERLVEIKKQQAGLIASKQEFSKQLREVVTEGQRLATLLRSAIKVHYGIRTEKVAEFGVKPFRGKNKKKKTAPETPALPPQPVPASTAK